MTRSWGMREQLWTRRGSCGRSRRTPSRYPRVRWIIFFPLHFFVLTVLFKTTPLLKIWLLLILLRKVVKKAVFRNRDLLVRIRILGSVSLTNGSGSFFLSVFPKFFCLLPFEGTFTSFFTDKKVIKKSQNSRNQGFFYFALWWVGSESGRPKNLQIRIRNTGRKDLFSQNLMLQKRPFCEQIQTFVFGRYYIFPTNGA
jgi:hypothetical protein